MGIEDYKNRIVLEYFKSHYKKYSYSEIMTMMGMTQKMCVKTVDALIDKGYLATINGITVLSRKGEEYIVSNRATNSCTTKPEIQERNRDDLGNGVAYIPKRFNV